MLTVPGNYSVAVRRVLVALHHTTDYSVTGFSPVAVSPLRPISHAQACLSQQTRLFHSVENLQIGRGSWQLQLCPSIVQSWAVSI